MDKVKDTTSKPAGQPIGARSNLLWFNLFAVLPWLYFTVQAFTSRNGFMTLMAITFTPVALTVVGLDVYRLIVRLRHKPMA